MIPIAFADPVIMLIAASMIKIGYHCRF